VGSVYVMGVDPGFSSVGVAIVSVCSSWEYVSDVRVIRTKKSGKKKNIRAMDDDFNRSVFIAGQMQSIIEHWRPVAIVAEEFSLVRNASSSAKVGRFWGILAALSLLHKLPVVQVMAVDVKELLCGNRSVSKKDVQGVLLERYSGFGVFMESTPKSLWEHGFDAVGVVVAGLDSDVIRMALKCS